MNFSLETKVGVFLVVAFILVTGITFKAGKFEIFSGKHYYYVTYIVPHGEELKVDASVVFRGLEVGKISSIHLVEEGVAVGMRLHGGYKITANVAMKVRKDAFIGTAFVELVEGDYGQIGNLLPEGVYYNSIRVASLGDIQDKMYELADDIIDITKEIKEMLSTDDSGKKVPKAISNVHDTSELLLKLLERNDDKIDETIDNVLALSKNLSQLVDSNDERVDKIFADVEQLAASLLQVATVLEKALEDKEGDIEEILVNTRNITDEMSQVAQQLSDDNGTLGMLINDEEVAENIRYSIDSVSGMVRSMNELKVQLSFAAEAYPEYDNYKGSFAVKIIPNQNKYYIFGVNNPMFPSMHTEYEYYKEENTDGTVVEYNSVSQIRSYYDVDFTLMYGLKFVDRFGLRLGMMESTAGGGFDYYPLANDDLSLSLDTLYYKENVIHMRVWGSYTIFDNFYITGGYDDILDRKEGSYFVGGGIKFYDDDLKYLITSIPMPSF